MIFVPMRQDDRAEPRAPGQGVREIRDDVIDPGQLVVGNHEPAIDRNEVVPGLDQHHVEADLAEATEGDQADNGLHGTPFLKAERWYHPVLPPPNFGDGEISRCLDVTGEPCESSAGRNEAPQARAGGDDFHDHLDDIPGIAGSRSHRFALQPPGRRSPATARVLRSRSMVCRPDQPFLPTRAGRRSRLLPLSSGRTNPGNAARLGAGAFGPLGGGARRAVRLARRPVRSGGLAALLMALLAVIFLRTALLLLPPRWSWIVALAGALGTQVWSTASRVLWSDTFLTLILGAAVWLLVLHETGRRRMSAPLLATLLAWGYFCRPTASLAIVAVTLYLVRYHQELVGSYLATGAVWIVVFVTYSWLTFGTLLPPYYRTGTFSLHSFGRGLVGILCAR